MVPEGLNGSFIHKPAFEELPASCRPNPQRTLAPCFASLSPAPSPDSFSASIPRSSTAPCCPCASLRAFRNSVGSCRQQPALRLPVRSHGRRHTQRPVRPPLVLRVSGVLFLLSAIFAAIPHTIVEFLLARFLGGLGIGLASTIAPLYLAEVSPARSAAASSPSIKPPLSPDCPRLLHKLGVLLHRSGGMALDVRLCRNSLARFYHLSPLRAGEPSLAHPAASHDGS